MHPVGRVPGGGVAPAARAAAAAGGWWGRCSLLGAWGGGGNGHSPGHACTLALALAPHCVHLSAEPAHAAGA